MIIHKSLHHFAIRILQFSIFNPLDVSAAEPVHKTLLSTDRNIYVKGWETKIKGGGWVRKETLHGGKQEGVDVITVENGKLKFTVIATRGMSIAEVTMDDIRIGWNSPVKELVDPKLVNLQSRGGLGWR